VLSVSSGDFITCLTLLFLEQKCGHLQDDLDQKLFHQQSKFEMNSNLQNRAKALFLISNPHVIKRNKSKPTLLS